MSSPVGVARGANRRMVALIGLGGAILSGVGDVLMLGRPSSGKDFDQASGLIPADIDADPRWQSLWNGRALAPWRLRLGTVTGLAGIALCQWPALHATARAASSARLRFLATVFAGTFVWSGCLTHLFCGRVIQAYQQAARSEDVQPLSLRPSPRSATTPLGLSALGALSSLAVFSVTLAIDAWQRRRGAPIVAAFVNPFSCVLTTLLAFGKLPSPVGGFARPASMSVGLLIYFAVRSVSQRLGLPGVIDHASHSTT